MGYRLSRTDGGKLFDRWAKQYEIFAPRRMEGEGCFSDTDVIRYGRVTSPEEICWERKSDYSPKEVLLAINETLFYFTEGQTTVPEGPGKDILIFLRSCDLHGVKRLDEIYLKNGFEDFYYKRVRERAKFILMGCAQTCSSGFCVAMGTNRCEVYDAYMKLEEGQMLLDIKDGALLEDMKAELGADSGAAGQETKDGGTACQETEDGKAAYQEIQVTPDYPKENREKVTLPRQLSNESFTKELWKEYGSRCIGCGRCAESCPRQVIQIQGGKASIDLKNCISCFCCQEMCPVKAIGAKRVFFG